MFKTRQLESLQQYHLPDGVLPLAPRQPFVDYSLASLTAFLKQAHDWPEIRGPLCSAARALELLPSARHLDRWIVVEVHVDAKGVTPDLANRLLQSGFEIDGFQSFCPHTLDSHYTLKMKMSPDDRARVRQLLREAKVQAMTAADLISLATSTEGYIESEIVSHSVV